MTVMPNQSPEPTAVGAGRSAIAVHVASRRWLSFLRLGSKTRLWINHSSPQILLVVALTTPSGLASAFLVCCIIRGRFAETLRLEP